MKIKKCNKKSINTSKKLNIIKIEWMLYRNNCRIKRIKLIIMKNN